MILKNKIKKLVKIYDNVNLVIADVIVLYPTILKKDGLVHAPCSMLSFRVLEKQKAYLVRAKLYSKQKKYRLRKM